MAIQKQAWQHVSTFPLAVIWDGFFTPEEPAFAFNSGYSLVLGTLILLSYKRLRLGDYGLALIFFFPTALLGHCDALFHGALQRGGLSAVCLFGPFLEKKPQYKLIVFTLFGCLQTAFMVLWTTGSYFII